MWTCSDCQQQFANTNQSHSCGHYTLNAFLQGKSTAVISLFYEFLDTYRTIGSFQLHPVKTRVALLSRIRFCAINKLGPDYLNGHLVLKRSYPLATCFYKIENLNNRFFVHHFRLKGMNDITEELVGYMREAYEVNK